MEPEPALDPDVRAAQERIAGWLLRMATVLDPAVRVASLRTDLAGLPSGALARALDDVATAADAGLEDFRTLLLHIGVALASPELDARRLESGRLAKELGLFTAAELLVAEAVEAIDAPGVIATVPGRTLTHGERKSMARTRSRAWLEKIARDPSPDVIRIFLGNPALTELEVVRLASRRPIESKILREVFLSTRFVLRPLVRLALVKNPALETHLALVLVRQLSRTEAREVAESGDIHATVRESAFRASRRAPLH